MACRAASAAQRPLWLRLIGLLAALWLGCTPALAFKTAPDRHAAEAVSLATQGLLPLLWKSDWRASSFSPDGRYLLVVDESRTFVLDASAGRELRGIRLPAGHKAVWSRHIPLAVPDFRWAVATDGGLLLDVDGETGRARVLNAFRPAQDGMKYREEDFTFEFVSPAVLVVNLNQRFERQEGNAKRTIENRRLLLHSAAGSSIAASVRVPPALHRVHSSSLLAVNVAAGLVGVAPRGGTMLMFWRFGATEGSERLGLACVYDGDEKVQALEPVGSGFVLVTADGKTRFLDPRPTDASKCSLQQPRKPDEQGCLFAEDIAVLAGRSRASSDFVAIAKDFSILRLRLQPAGCISKRLSLGNVKTAFYDVPLFRSGEAMKSDDPPEWNGFVAVQRESDVVVVAGPSLVRLANDSTSPIQVQSLAGRPTGALELESAPGFLVASRSMAPLRAFDIAAGRLRTFNFDFRKYLEEAWFYHRPYALASKLQAVAVLDWDATLRFEQATSAVDTSRLPKTQRLDVEAPNALCSSEDGRFLWVLTSSTLYAFELDNSGMFQRAGSLQLGERRDVFKIACAASGNVAVASDSLSDAVFVAERQGASIALAQTFDVPRSGRLMARPMLSGDALVLAVGPHLYARRGPGATFTLKKTLAGASGLVFDAGATQAFSLGDRARLYDMTRTGDTVRLTPKGRDFGTVEGAGFMGDGFLAIMRGGEHLEVRSVAGRDLGRLVFGDDGQWLFTDGQGRFDTYDAEGRASAYWVMKDDPMRALDPELYMRDYLEPRLLPRLMECVAASDEQPSACTEAFPKVRPVHELNRARPEVTILDVIPQPGDPHTVALRLAVTGTREPSRRGARSSKLSGAFDLHLRLNGQLVARRPTRDSPPLAGEPSETWTETRRVVDGADRVELLIPNIRLPHSTQPRDVEFSAYAFNSDRVKGPTHTRRHQVPASASVQRRAFVVGIGVSAYQDPRLDLRFPAEDAGKLVDAVVPALRGTGRFDQIIPLKITSEWKPLEGKGRQLVTEDATKARIRHVLEVLSGSVADPSFPHPPATPDDTMIVLFAGHGLNHEQEFYLVPFDSGFKRERSTERPPLDLSKQVSSVELSHWLRDLVADEIVLVIDACHSAASVDTPGFKPGPMGARGFGQLAYDKGMRVLTSTRPNDLAWESQDKGLGLLTYALLEEGLIQRLADRIPSDGSITFSEWLQYAVDRVPSLYGEVSRGTAGVTSRLVDFDVDRRQARVVSVEGRRVETGMQQPSVFNFRRGQDPALLGPTPRGGTR